MEEAGYRCAIPTCKGTAALQMAHIEPWAKVREHRFENLIVLCSNDHFRFDSGEIPKKSIEAYKANLGLLRSRYSDAERRILEAFAIERASWQLDTRTGYPIAGGTAYTMMYLVKDGLVEVEAAGGVVISGLPSYELVTLTERGVEVVRRMQQALIIDERAQVDVQSSDSDS